MEDKGIPEEEKREPRKPTPWTGATIPRPPPPTPFTNQFGNLISESLLHRVSQNFLYFHNLLSSNLVIDSVSEVSTIYSLGGDKSTNTWVVNDTNRVVTVTGYITNIGLTQ